MFHLFGECTVHTMELYLRTKFTLQTGRQENRKLVPSPKKKQIAVGHICRSKQKQKKTHIQMIAEMMTTASATTMTTCLFIYLMLIFGHTIARIQQCAAPNSTNNNHHNTEQIRHHTFGTIVLEFLFLIFASHAPQCLFIYVFVVTQYNIISGITGSMLVRMHFTFTSLRVRGSYVRFCVCMHFDVSFAFRSRKPKEEKKKIDSIHVLNFTQLRFVFHTLYPCRVSNGCRPIIISPNVRLAD